MYDFSTFSGYDPEDFRAKKITNTKHKYKIFGNNPRKMYGKSYREKNFFYRFYNHFENENNIIINSTASCIIVWSPDFSCRKTIGDS